jgi:CheY-like chemotaxis protein
MSQTDPHTTPAGSLPSAPSILVVDDEPAFCDVVCEVLQMFGFDVRHALSARVALKLLATQKPDLIMTDLMMPGIDGLHLLRRLRATPAWSHIPTIAVSALGSPEEQSAAKQAGADAYLAKPFSVDQLRMTINQFLSASQAKPAS